ncbi:carbon storage regulator CsrA [Aminiphilus circumscriptus]|uniref:carbon storage regulator CsrA n=1 Tax=Aminiphilus circumscriptus TaxID=290732 RepID=UPI00049240A9|nr:carbon storage regulator CsrA [Aminiphilus circumscriptus]
MLVLTRKVGEGLVIGEDIEIVIVETRGDSVRIGISAPRSVGVWRKELWDQIREENLRAAAQSPSAPLEDLFPKKEE